MREWHRMTTDTQRRMLTENEKLEVVREKLDETSEEEGWGLIFSAEQVQNKVDALKKKVKKTYDKFTKKTATGSAVESKIDLQVSTRMFSRPWVSFSQARRTLSVEYQSTPEPQES